MDSLARNVQMEHLMSNLVDYFKESGNVFRPFSASETSVRYGDNEVNFADRYRNIKSMEAIDIDLFDVQDGMMIPNQNFYDFMSFYEKVDTKDVATMLEKLNIVGFEKVSGILVPYDHAKDNEVILQVENMKDRITQHYRPNITAPDQNQQSIFNRLVGMFRKETEPVTKPSISDEEIFEMISENIPSVKARTAKKYYESVQGEIAQKYAGLQNEMVDIASEHGAKLITNVDCGHGWSRNHLVTGDGEKSTHTSIMSHNLQGSYECDDEGYRKWVSRPDINYYGTSEEYTLGK